MSVFVNILTCASDGTNCCSDYKLASALDILNKTLKLLQLILPIILIVMLSVQIVKLVVNPDSDSDKKSMINKGLAIVIFFMLPIIVNIIFGLLPTNMEVSKCWKEATATKKKLGNNNPTIQKGGETKVYKQRKVKKSKISPTKKKSKKKIKAKKSINALIARNRNKKLNALKHKTVGSEKGIKLVNYAKKFLGKRNKSGGLRYCYGGSNPNKCTDCSGFVGYVFKHFGISLPRVSTSIPSTSAKYKKVTNGKLKAGDIVVYSSKHVAIATGKGNQVIHASCEKVGITLTNSYKAAGKGKITIMRLDKIN
ncbi:MAG: C40 family peptidase [Bacilli bacterium]|nr:C40 family peptidase [Bacilli bacterium]